MSADALRREAERYEATAKCLRLAIELLEGPETTLSFDAIAKLPVPLPPPLSEPSRKTRGDRGGSKKPPSKPAKRKRSAPKYKPPNGTDCDRGSEGGCSEDFYASNACKKCGRVQQRCTNHGGRDEVRQAATGHGHDHRWGRVDSHGNRRDDELSDDAPMGRDEADDPSELRGARAALSLGEL